METKILAYQGYPADIEFIFDKEKYELNTILSFDEKITINSKKSIHYYTIKSTCMPYDLMQKLSTLKHPDVVKIKNYIRVFNNNSNNVEDQFFYTKLIEPKIIFTNHFDSSTTENRMFTIKIQG